MQKKFKVVFKNKLDIQVFSQDFYQTLLDNIIKLKKTNWEQDVCLSWYKTTCLSQAKFKRKHVKSRVKWIDFSTLDLNKKTIN